MSQHQTDAVVLLSGGVDSSTCLAMAAVDHRCHALTLHYGQRNHLELESARRVAAAVGAAHQVLEVPLNWLRGSALVGANGPRVPLSVDGVHPSRPPVSGVPVTYVPARNSVFLAMGAAWAESLGTPHLFIGVNRVDYSGYPDCRPEFVEAMQRALRLGTNAGDLQIHTPLIDLTKGEIIGRGSALGLDYALTWSCYDPQPARSGPVPWPLRGGASPESGAERATQYRACGLCDSCIHRKKGFMEAGIPDPTLYVS